MAQRGEPHMMLDAATEEVGGLVRVHTTNKRNDRDEKVSPRRKTPRRKKEYFTEVGNHDDEVGMTHPEEEGEQAVPEAAMGVPGTALHQRAQSGALSPEPIPSEVPPVGTDRVPSIRSLRADIEEQAKQLQRLLDKNSQIDFAVEEESLSTAIAMILARARTISDEYFSLGSRNQKGNGRKREVQRVLEETLAELAGYQSQIQTTLIKKSVQNLGLTIDRTAPAGSPRPVVVEGEPPISNDAFESKEGLPPVGERVQPTPEPVAPRIEKFLAEIFGDSIPQETARELWKFLDDEMREYRKSMRAWMRKEKVPMGQRLNLLNHSDVVPRFLDSLLSAKLKVNGLTLPTEVEDKLRAVMQDYISKIWHEKEKQ